MSVQGRVPKSPISSEVKDSFVQFSRNGRWGTCASCPRDDNNVAYPEFCENTNQADHNLNVDQLAEQHKNYLK